MTALCVGAASAALRSSASATVPGALPVRSSGTASDEHEKPVAFAHGVYVSAAPAGLPPVPASTARKSVAANEVVSVRSGIRRHVTATGGRETPFRRCSAGVI